MANITDGDVRGFQLGVFNVSRSATGSLGLVNIFLDGYVQPEVTVSDDGLLMVGIRHGSRAFFNTYGLGQRVFGPESSPGALSELAATLGLGWRLELAEALDVSVELTATSVMVEPDGWLWSSDFTLYKLKPQLSYEVVPNLTVFGGPTLTLFSPSSGEVDATTYAPWEPWRVGDSLVLWPGLSAGLRFF